MYRCVRAAVLTDTNGETYVRVPNPFRLDFILVLAAFESASSVVHCTDDSLFPPPPPLFESHIEPGLIFEVFFFSFLRFVYNASARETLSLRLY